MSQRDGISGTLTSGSAVTVTTSRVKLPATVAVYPVAGDTVTVEYSMNGSTWTAWSFGGVTAAQMDVLDAPVAQMRFTRSAGSGTTSTYHILPSQS